MGYIKEPKGIDFIISGEPWTDEETKMVSEFIRKEKAKQFANQLPLKKRHRTVRKTHLF